MSRQDIQQYLHGSADSGAAQVTTADALDESPPVMVPEPFVIDDAAKAAWVVRKIVEARKYAQHVQKWCERELRRAAYEEEWLMRRFAVELEAWTRSELTERGGRRRSLNLPGGTVGFRMQPARLEVIDESAALTWCRANLPLALKVTVEANDRQGIELLGWHEQHAPLCRLRQQVLREPLNEHASDTGELPAGTGMRAAIDQFYVKE